MEEELEESSFDGVDVRPPRPVFSELRWRVYSKIESAFQNACPARCCRGWKLVMLPRMLLQQRSSGCNR